MNNDDTFLQVMGGVENNSLNSKLNLENHENDENNQIQIIKHSSYFDNERFDSLIENKTSCFSVVSTNAQSINAKFDELNIFLNNLKEKKFEFSAVCIQESWLSENDDKSQIQLENYHIISQGKSCSTKGGLLIYLHKRFEYKIKMTLNKYDDWEGQVIEITKGGLTKPILLANIYRPPKDLTEKYKQFLQELSPILQSLENNRAEVLITGDFNIDLLKLNEKEVISDFFDTLTENSFYPKITLPTRFSNKHGTLIDNIFCKLTDTTLSTTSGILIKQFSDHQPYFTFLDNIFLKDPAPKLIKINNSSEAAVLNFQKAIISADLLNKIDQSPTADPNSNYNIMHEIIENAKEIHIPSKTVKFNKHKHKKTKWVTSGLIKSIKFRDNLYKRLKMTNPDTEEYEIMNNNLKVFNGIIKKSIRTLKKDHYEASFKKFKGDIRNTWKMIYEILNKTKKKKSFPDAFQVDEGLITDKLEIANRFNVFFTNIGTNLASKITSTSGKKFSDFLNKKYINEFKFRNIDEESVSKIINAMKSKTSSGFDGISLKLLKSLKETLIKPLVIIINQTLNTGIFPDKLKIAKIVPIFKKDDNTQFTNYRPISLLPATSKIFERVMYDQLFSFFQKHKLFYNSQYGFRTEHSTELAVLEVVDRLITQMDKNETPINIYLDLSKAFDTLDHQILTSKLEYYGIKGSPLNLFKNYLTNRKQYVEYEGAKSEMLNLTTGVPQGSILGPLLFIIYINDMANVSKLFNFIMYADDTTLSSILSSFGRSSVCENKLNTELANISEWLKVNKLSLNISKTKFMIFHTRQKKLPKLSLKIDGIEIDRAANFNFLGLIINEHLRWKPHTEKISNNISKTIGILNKLKHFLPLETKVILYNSLILSHLNYCLLIWGYELGRVVKLQKRAIRTITISKYNAHTEPLFKSLKLMNIYDNLQLQELKFYYKYSNNQLPFYFQNTNTPHPTHDKFIICQNHNIHNHHTRRKNNIHISHLNHTFAKKCLRHNIPLTLNKTPKIILDKIQTHSFQGFAKYIKNVCLQNYTETCQIQNCYICQRNQ